MLFFEEQLSVELPESFQKMEDSKIDSMYPYEEKPQIILEDKEMHRFCTFSLLKSQDLTADQTEYAIQIIFKVVTSLYPACLIDEPKQTDCGEGKCSWFSFKTAGTDGEIYNVMYIYPVNESMMLGTMGCRSLDEPGKKQMMEILGTLKSLRKKYSYEILNQNWQNRKI